MIDDQSVLEAMGVAGSSRGYRFNAQRIAAKRRGLSWALEFEQFHRLTISACHYCGGPPANVHKIKRGLRTLAVLYQGIDRVDNGRGYEPDNVVPCCARCNTAKGDRPVAAFRSWAQRIAERAA